MILNPPPKYKSDSHHGLPRNFFSLALSLYPTRSNRNTPYPTTPHFSYQQTNLYKAAVKSKGVCACVCVCVCVVQYAVIKTNSVDTNFFTANPKQLHVSAEQSSQNQDICVFFFFFPFHWLYIPGWDLTSSLTFHHFSPDCTLILQFLHPTRATVFSASSHRRKFGQILLTPTPPAFVQRTFFAGSLSSILITCPAHLSLSRLKKAVCVRKCKNENYTAVAVHMIIKCMAKILPLHKAYVNVKSGKHFYKI